MSRARPVLPTDLVALVTFDGRIYPNEAKTWDRMGPERSYSKPQALETAIEQWLSFATGKHAWVSVRGMTIRGLISARRRSRPTAWEVDCLVDAGDDEGVALSLVERMLEGVAKQGAERVFLRLNSESALIDKARQAGFFTYSREALYRSTRPLASGPEATGLQAQTKEDLFAVYQLYNKVVPANIRAAEGATLREWQAALEPWGGRPTHLTLKEHGAITAWLRVSSGHCGRFSILAQREGDGLDALVRLAISRLKGSHSYACLVPAYDLALARSLERQGFAPVEEYTALMKRLLKPTEEIAAEKVGTAVPVS